MCVFAPVVCFTVDTVDLLSINVCQQDELLFQLNKLRILLLYFGQQQQKHTEKSLQIIQLSSSLLKRATVISGIQRDASHIELEMVNVIIIDIREF